MSKAKTVLTIVCIVVLHSHFNASTRGGLIVYNDRDDFNMQGTVVFNSNFADLATVDPFVQAINGPFTRGDVTYDPSGSDDYVVVGTSSILFPVQNVIANDLFTPLSGTMNNAYNMFGFDVGALLLGAVNNPVKIAITTNLSTYEFNNNTLSLASSSLDFFLLRTLPQSTSSLLRYPRPTPKARSQDQASRMSRLETSLKRCQSHRLCWCLVLLVLVWPFSLVVDANPRLARCELGVLRC